MQGERLAERHLRRKGLKLLARRFSAPVGELDLVMRAGQTIVFVEVKTQRSRVQQDPQEQVTPAKQRKLHRIAQWYLRAKGWEERPGRFDIVAVVIPEEGPAEIEHIEDAFVPG